MAAEKQSKNVDLATMLSASALEAAPLLAERMPLAEQPPASTPAISIAAPPDGLQIKKIDRVHTGVRVPADVFESLENLMEGKRRGVWVEHQLSKLFDSMDETAVLQLVIDRSAEELEVEDKDTGDKIFAARVDRALLEVVNATADRLQCTRSLVFRTWLCAVVDQHKE